MTFSNVYSNDCLNPLEMNYVLTCYIFYHLKKLFKSLLLFTFYGFSKFKVISTLRDL